MLQPTSSHRALAHPPAISRRHWLVAGAALCASTWGRAAPSSGLPMAVSLANELAAALKQGNPLVVMVSLDRCPFCIVVRDHYLAPLRVQQALPVVQVDMRSALVVKDFKGDALTHDQCVRRWGVKVAPTVLFFGPGGVEVAERLSGAYLPDFYGAYLDDRLSLARAAIKAKV